MRVMRYDADAQVAGEPAGPPFARTIRCPIWATTGPTHWLLLLEHDRIHSGVSRLL